MHEVMERGCARRQKDGARDPRSARFLRVGVAMVTALVLVAGGASAAGARTTTSSSNPGTSSAASSAVHPSGAMDAARVRTGTPLGIPRKAPSKPSVSVSYPRSGEARLSWTAPRSNGSPITAYVVQRRVNGTWKTIKTLPATARSFVVTRLPNGSTYSFRVLARNKSGSSPWSSTISAKPRAPRGCHASYGGPCVPIASDVDCKGGSGNGPKYVRGPVYVLRGDPYGLDRDGDRVACEP